MRHLKPLLNLFIVLGIVLPLVNCAARRTSGEYLEVSSFLGDVRPYLVGGAEKEAFLVYRNPTLDPAQYTTVILESVKFITRQDSTLAQVSKADRTNLAKFAYKAFKEELAKNFKVVALPDSKTLRIEIAITDATVPGAVLETVNSATAALKAGALMQSLMKGRAPLLGKLSTEARVTDSVSGKIVIASANSAEAVNSNPGANVSWGDVDKTLRNYATQFQYNLCEALGRTNCIP